MPPRSQVGDVEGFRRDGDEITLREIFAERHFPHHALSFRPPLMHALLLHMMMRNATYIVAPREEALPHVLVVRQSGLCRHSIEDDVARRRATMMPYRPLRRLSGVVTGTSRPAMRKDDVRFYRNYRSRWSKRGLLLPAAGSPAFTCVPHARTRGLRPPR